MPLEPVAKSKKSFFGLFKSKEKKTEQMEKKIAEKAGKRAEKQAKKAARVPEKAVPVSTKQTERENSDDAVS